MIMKLSYILENKQNFRFNEKFWGINGMKEEKKKKEKKRIKRSGHILVKE